MITNASLPIYEIQSDNSFGEKNRRDHQAGIFFSEERDCSDW